MKDGTPRGVMADLNPQRRRSARLVSPLSSDNKMAQTAAVKLKRSITVRKLAPGKSAFRPGQEKENTPGKSAFRPGREKENTPGKRAFQPDREKENTPGKRAFQPGREKENTPGKAAGDAGPKKPKVSTPGPAPGCRAAMPSPILPSPPRPAAEPADAAWSRKVRRSYSRLSDPDPRLSDALFGFGQLQTPAVVRRGERSGSGPDASGAGLNSFASLLEAEDSGPAPDPNIPGVVVVRERRRRRRKVPQIDGSELEELAARMNAEFEEAEEFQLVVE